VSLANPLDLFGALVDSGAWPILSTGLHAAFFLVGFFILKRIYDFRRLTELPRLRKRGRGLMAPLALLVLAFLAVLVYQATWQLTGLFRPQFVSFMQSYDRRQFNPAHLIQRGRILDHRGEVLAYSREYGNKVHRLYPYGPAFSHTVGYAHPRFGATGAEAAANEYLNGATPERLEAWSELGRHLVTQDKRPRGQDLMLTLDTQLQLSAIQGLGNSRGAVVLLRPDNGAVLALASTPSYDPNRLVPALFRGHLQGAPLMNRATQGLYPPGSTFKVVTAAMAIDGGFSGTIYCPADGYTTSSHYRKIRDHEYYSAKRAGEVWTGFGKLDLATALAKSSNVFFAQLGVRYGHDAFERNAARFWFGRQIRLYPGTNHASHVDTGRIPRIADSDLYGLAQASIGQGRMMVTPAHMATIAAAVANQGVAMRPRLMASDPPEVLARYMAATTARRLARMMRMVVAEGTGRGIDRDDLAIAGKTGTAENPHGRSHSWFIGFAPSDRPALAVAVLVEQGGYGSQTAAPIARDLFLSARDAGLLR
jgi:peptidoglycan glycosyltransferase